MADIFISYARKDESRILGLVKALEARSRSVFWDRRIPAGQTWRSYIGNALAEARCVIVAWSQHSVDSAFVMEEADDAMQRGLLVPVMIDPVILPLGFRSIQTADLSGWQPNQPSQPFEQLVRDIAALIDQGHAGTQPRRDIAAEPQRNPAILRKAAKPSAPKRSRAFAYAGLAAALIVAAAFKFIPLDDTDLHYKGNGPGKIIEDRSGNTPKVEDQGPVGPSNDSVGKPGADQPALPSRPVKIALHTLGLSNAQFDTLYGKILEKGFIKDERSAAWDRHQPWLAKRSTVLFFDRKNRPKALRLAMMMNQLTGDKFEIVKGLGAGIAPEEYATTLIVHYIAPQP